MKLPKSRTENIVVQPLDNEVLIYDLITNKAFCLNETLAIIYQSCDGITAFDELERKHQFSADVVFLALDELQKKNLLAGHYESKFAGVSRREVIRRVGLASMIALPVIAAIVAPTAAHAQSNCRDPLATSGIPPGCRVGNSVNDVVSCAGETDADRDSICSAFFRTRCASGTAVYEAGTCTPNGPGFSYYYCDCA